MKKQYTFEEIGILDFIELEKISFEMGNGYGGYDATGVFDKLLPKGYSLDFIKWVMSDHYLCIIGTNEEGKFEKLLEEYKKSPIIEWKYIPCPTCDNNHKQIRKSYKRIGDCLNVKGKLIEIKEFDI